MGRQEGPLDGFLPESRTVIDRKKVNGERMFRKLVPVNKEQHKDLKIRAIEGFGYAKDFHIASLMVHEFARAASVYPIVFIEDKEKNEWVLLNYDKKRSSLGTLYYIILEHLNTCVLGYPNMIEYMQKIFEIKADNIDFIKDHEL